MELFQIRAGNGIMLASMCKGDGDEKCFTGSSDKHCDHNVTTIKLDGVGDYLVFPSRFYHRGYYRITSNKTYYTAQLFCKATESFKAWQNVTRKVNQDMIPGRSRIEVDTTHARHTRQLGHNILCQCVSACKGIRRGEDQCH